MPVNVGDAVLTFKGDTTRLDVAFDSLGPKAKAAIDPANEAVSDLGDSMGAAGKQGTEAFGKVSKSARGATEQVRFLGEETGVRLPRAMASLVADLPGVGAALNAAFTITAIIFAIKEINELSNKLADWVFGVKDASKANEEWNKSIGDADAKMKAAGRALADYGKSADDLAREHVADLVDAIDEHNKAVDEARFEMSYLKQGTDAYTEASRKFVEQTKLAKAAIDEHTLAVKRLLDTEAEEARTKNLEHITKEIALRKKLGETMIQFDEAVHGLDKDNADEMRYQVSLRALQAQSAAESKFGKDSEDKVKSINADIEALQVAHVLKMVETYKKLKDDEDKLLSGMSKDFTVHGAVDIVQPESLQKLLAFQKEAQALGITIGGLSQKTSQAKQALADYIALGGKDNAMLSMLRTKINEAADAEKNFGTATIEQNQNQLKSLELTLQAARAKGEDTTAIQNQIKALNTLIRTQKAANDISQKTIATQEHMRDTVNQVSMEMGNAVAGAMSAMLSHQETFGRAMERAVLSMIAKQAEAWGEYYIALGMATIWTDPAAGAGMLAEGLILEALGGALGSVGSGGGSGSGGNASNPNSNNQVFQYGSSQSNTGNQAGSGRSAVGVQGFATGALITRPTLAMFAETGPEVAIPLNDPQAKKAVGEALGSEGGVQNHFHFHAPVIGASDVARMCSTVSKKVSRGQATLTASNSMRITKRSA